MAKALAKFAASLEELEQEIGIEKLSQHLAEVLLACSARTVGDASNSWTVNTNFVCGEVVATTDRALDSQG